MFKPEPGKEYPTETESRVIIRFQDCDPLRHLNNAKYFDYFFNAREDQVPKLYGVEYVDFIKSFKAIWVVYNHHIAYLRSANMGEWVRIKSRIVWFNENTLVVEYLMLDDKKTHLKTLMWTTLKYVGMETGRTVSHSDEVLKYLESTQHKGVNYHPHRFDERVKEVKDSIRQSV